MPSKAEIIENAVKQTMQEMEERAPMQMHRLKQDPEKYERVLKAARESATEEVILAEEFVGQPADILVRLKKHLPERRIQLIEKSLSIPTYRINIAKGDGEHHVAHFERDGQEFVAPRKLETKRDVDWTKIMQYSSIVEEAVLLVVSAIGVDISPSAKTTEEAAEEVAEVMKNSSQFQAAVEAFVEEWDKAGGSAYKKAMALFKLIKATKAAGLFWTVIKSLCSHMKWYDWLEISAKVTAMIVAALATDGAALIAKIALVALQAVDFAKKIANIVQLKQLQ